MNSASKPCPFEEQVIAGRDGELAHHVASCNQCQETVRVRRLMNIEAASLIAQANPSTTASTILWKASLRKGRIQAERASRSVQHMEGVMLVTVVLAFAMVGYLLAGSVPGGLILLLSLGAVAAPICIQWLGARRKYRQAINPN